MQASTDVCYVTLILIWPQSIRTAVESESNRNFSVKPPHHQRTKRETNLRSSLVRVSTTSDDVGSSWSCFPGEACRRCFARPWDGLAASCWRLAAASSPATNLVRMTPRRRREPGCVLGGAMRSLNASSSNSSVSHHDSGANLFYLFIYLFISEFSTDIQACIRYIYNHGCKVSTSVNSCGNPWPISIFSTCVTCLL